MFDFQNKNINTTTTITTTTTTATAAGTNSNNNIIINYFYNNNKIKATIPKKLIRLKQKNNILRVLFQAISEQPAPFRPPLPPKGDSATFSPPVAPPRRNIRKGSTPDSPFNGRQTSAGDYSQSPL